MPKKLRRHEDEDFDASENDNFDNQIVDPEEVKGNIGSEDKELIDQSDEEEIISDEEEGEDVLSAGDDHEDEESDQASKEFKTNKKVLKAESKKGETVSARIADASKQPPKPVWKYNESSSDDDDDAPEEVGTAAKKQETLDLYKIQKEAAIA